MNNFANAIRLGDFGWPELWGCSGDKYPNAKMPEMMAELYDNGYDVILLDFEDGADYIQRNGLLLKELINRVNQHKIGNEELVVMGVSMGGQVVRWTLTHMEAHNENHCARLFVSHDSPWTGAVLPPSIMYTFTYLAEAKGHKKAQDALRNLNRPAPIQLLLHHLSYDGINPVYATVNGDYHRYFTYNGSASTVLREQFIQEVMQNGNYPKLTRNVAITNGNISGIQKYGNGDGLFEMNSSCIGATIQFGLFSKNRSDHLVTNIKEPKYRRRQWYVSGLPNMSGSPGGSRNDLFKAFRDSMVNEIPGYCYNVTVPTAYQVSHTFIPTLSGLGINHQNWMFNIENNINPHAPTLSGLTHFDAFFGPSGIDELHGKITDDNLIWLMRQITLGENKLANSTGGVLTSVWNNPTENQFLGTLEVEANGILKLNANGPIYDFTATTDPHTIAGSLSRVSIGSACSPGIVEVENGGKLVLGDLNGSSPTQNNKSYLEIGNGSALNLKQGSEAEILGYSKILVKPGGILRIYNGAELICHENTVVEIEEGGILEYHQGAIINLLSSNSYLLLKGTLDIKNNAIFDISGNGFIKWEKGNINPIITAGTNTKFMMEGSSLSYKLMELSNNTILNFPSTLEFELKNGKVFCAPGSGINISGKTTLFNSWFAGTGGATQPFNGVTVSSTQLNDIRFSYFDYANTGLNLIQTGNPNMPTLTGNRFRWCVIGLKIHDKGAVINGNHFISNNNGLTLFATSSRINVSGSNFEENFNAIKIYGTNPSPIQITTSSIVWTGGQEDHMNIGIECDYANLELRANTVTGYRYGIYMGSGYLRAACNTISGSEFGIEAYAGTTVNIANEARNNISNNSTGIGIDKAWLKLHNGRNKLDGNADRSISGTIEADIYVKQSLLTQTGTFHFYKYNFSNNLLNNPIVFPGTYNGQVGGQLINGTPDVYTSYQEYLLNPYNPGEAIVSYSDNIFDEPLFFECSPCTFDYITCSQASPPWYTELYPDLMPGTDPTQFVLTTPRFQQIELKDAIRQALDHLTFDYEYPQLDLLALAELKDILTYNYGADKDEIVDLLGSVRHAMTQGLANAYTNGLLPIDYGVIPNELSEYAIAILSELDALIDQDPNDYDKVGYYTIEKAQVYRLAGHYSSALDELNSTNASYAPNKDFWLCICEEEWDFLRGNISLDQFIANTGQCNDLFQARRMRMRSMAREGIYQKPNLTQLVINPTALKRNYFMQHI